MGDIDDWWPLAVSKGGIKAFLDLPWISWVLLYSFISSKVCCLVQARWMLQALRRPPWRVSAGKAVKMWIHISITAFSLWWCLVMELCNTLNQMTHDYHRLQAVVLCDRKCSCSDSWIAQVLGGIWLYLMQFWIRWEWTKQSATQD